MNKKNTTFKLTFSAIMIALSTALSLIKIFKLPWGGSITLLSMLPICMISIAFGTVYAIAPCILYGVVQMFIDGVLAWGLTPKTLAVSIIFDYILAFGVLCLAGLFRKKGTKGIYGGIALGTFLRLFCHFIAGKVWFDLYPVDQLVEIAHGNAYLYSLIYNAAYMLPEIIITLVGAFLIFRMDSIKKLLLA